MGESKAGLQLNGKSLLELARDKLAAVTSEIHVVGKRAELGNEAIEDVYPERGPLGGIHAALSSSSKVELNLMLAVDLPFIETVFLRYLLKRARETSATVTLPRVGGGWQPLCAVYRPAFLPAAEKALKQGRNKIDALFAGLQLCVLEGDELQQAGFLPGIFDNINTPEEWQKARQRASMGAE